MEQDKPITRPNEGDLVRYLYTQEEADKGLHTVMKLYNHNSDYHRVLHVADTGDEIFVNLSNWGYVKVNKVEVVFQI